MEGEADTNRLLEEYREGVNIPKPSIRDPGHLDRTRPRSQRRIIGSVDVRKERSIASCREGNNDIEFTSLRILEEFLV